MERVGALRALPILSSLGYHFYRVNLPNLLTLLRIFFVPLLVAALLADGTWIARWQSLVPISREIFALAVFLAAAATDLLDGFLARRWGQVTTVGTLLDP